MPLEHTAVQKSIGAVGTFRAILATAVLESHFLHAAPAAAAGINRKRERGKYHDQHLSAEIDLAN